MSEEDIVLTGENIGLAHFSIDTAPQMWITIRAFYDQGGWFVTYAFGKWGDPGARRVKSFEDMGGARLELELSILRAIHEPADRVIEIIALNGFLEVTGNSWAQREAFTEVELEGRGGFEAPIRATVKSDDTFTLDDLGAPADMRGWDIPAGTTFLDATEAEETVRRIIEGPDFVDPNADVVENARTSAFKDIFLDEYGLTKPKPVREPTELEKLLPDFSDWRGSMSDNN